MPTYALLGATGATGSAILRYLLEEPIQDLKLNILVRNKAKLLNQFPELESSTTFNPNIVEGTSDDGKSLRNALKNAAAVFMCIATNESRPNQTLAQDTTKSIINALKQLQTENGPGYVKPTVLMLRTASLNETFAAQAGWEKTMAHFCLHYVYEDLELACKQLESTAKEDAELLDYIFVDPPSIHDADGTTRTGHELTVDKNPKPTLMYADLGAGFCEIAQRRNEFKGKGVGVSATGKVNETWGVLLGYLGLGLKSRVIG